MQSRVTQAGTPILCSQFMFGDRGLLSDVVVVPDGSGEVGVRFKIRATLSFLEAVILCPLLSAPVTFFSWIPAHSSERLN